MKTKRLSYIVLSIAILIAVNFISQQVFFRLDLTTDQRYTLSSNSKQITQEITSPMVIDVFLEGDLPAEFRLLRSETKQLLEEIKINNEHIIINYINPLEDEDTRERNVKALTEAGLQPYVSTSNSSSKVTQELIFPWAFASYNNNTIKISLLKQSITEDLRTQINASIENLEYTFINAFQQLSQPKNKTIAILKGNGQLNDIYIADFLKTIQPYYNIAPFTLDSVDTNPLKTLKDLTNYDLIISAKPNTAFSEKEKLVLDQYTMQGGKSIWLTEGVVMDKDSLYNSKGASVSMLKDLNLNDFFFSYGARINPVLVKDLFSAPITLAIGEGSQSQLQPVQWQYAPLAASNPKHPITKNINLVKFDFASPIDTLKSGPTSQILLTSSGDTRLEGVPTQISLASVTEPPNEASYNAGKQPLAVLLEGQFKSVYKNRVLPFSLEHFNSESVPTQMVIIGDGDLIKNGVRRNQPQPLGFDPLTGTTFGNKEFLLNTVNYLLDDQGLIRIRSKSLKTAFLDENLIKSQRLKWQVIHIVLPLVVLGLFGLVFHYSRRRKNA